MRAQDDVMNLSRGLWLKVLEFLWRRDTGVRASRIDASLKLCFPIEKINGHKRVFCPCYLCVFQKLLSVKPFSFLPINFFAELCVNLPLLFLKCPYNVSQLKSFNQSFKSVLKPCLGYAFIPSVLQQCQLLQRQSISSME